MRILNFGSLNVDHVYRVPHIARPGQTIAAASVQTFAGGKGANQSVALARAGATVSHAGRIGRDGHWLLDKLKHAGVDTTLVQVDDKRRTGHAIIQVDDKGENTIVLFGGANRSIDGGQIDRAVRQFGSGDMLLLQNEVNRVPDVIEAGHARGMTVCFNPAPADDQVKHYPLEHLDVMILNQSEGQTLCGASAPDDVLTTLSDRYPQAQIILTLGKDGVRYAAGDKRLSVAATPAKTVDTTAAGDTFIGYYLAGRAAGSDVPDALQTACRAAALCVSSPGAMDSIPTHHELATTNRH